MKMRRLTAFVLSAATAISCYAAAPAVVRAESTDPLVSVTFDEGGTAYTAEGGATMVEGRNGNALSLNGNGQYAEVSAAGKALSGISGDFTISVWVNPTSLDNWARIYDFGNGMTDATAYNYAFLTANSGDSTARFAVKDGSAEKFVNAQSILSTGDWQNIVVSHSGDVTTLYVNGKQSGSTDTITYNFSDLGGFANCYLGKSQFSADSYFSGLIDDLLIYDRALSADEIKALAAEEYVEEDENAENINKYNCLLMDTKYYVNDERVFALGENTEGTLKAVTTVKNYTSSSAEVSAVLSNSDASFSAASEKTTIASGETAEIKMEKEISDLAVGDTLAVTLSNGSREYKLDALEVTANELVNPKVAPADSDNTTYGAHDPSIVQFPGDDTYYVYSSHHLIFTSDDLINWKKYDFTAKKVKDISPKTYSFISSNYTNTTCNDTYWAPDVIYRKDDTEHPYWMYISVSCGLGGRNSAIALMKSDNPLFWADGSSDIVDAGVVYATKENSSYVTNAIDANIYTEADGTENFVWGSFWGGIQSAQMNGTAPGAMGIENQIIKDGKVSFTLYDAKTYGTADIIVAEYDKNGALVGIKTQKAEITSNKQDISVDYTQQSEADPLKVYAWDADMTAEADSKSVTDTAPSYTLADGAGFLKDIDYTSNSTILTSSAAVKNSIFTQKSGVAGPEGAWIFEHNGYRYAFTSYGWLGSNYNTRVARSSLDKSFADSTLVDANGVDMSTQYTKGSLSNVTGYKLIGSFRLGDGSTKLLEDSNNDFYYAREEGDAHIYYGPGHNSAITARDGETFFVSHTRKDAVEGAAWLQVRKMLWTEDGWPIVNPVVYAGETEQALPKTLLEGTYDLASVGHTKMDGTAVSNNWTNHNGNRNYDLPVISSKVTLNADGGMVNAKSASIGTWSFDGDHKLTLSFTANGDTSLDEFYKNGDVMEMYALLSYDKDEAEYVISLTGTDENHVTQFAKKELDKTYYSEVEVKTSEPLELTKSIGGNPELGFDSDGNILYGGDPAATVLDTDGDGTGDTVYLIVGHDASTYAYNDSSATYSMPNWLLYTSTDMTNWEYKGEIMSAKDISWANDTRSAWAGQMTEYKGKYYFYFCTWDKTSNVEQSIGVAVADKPEGPYKDIGKPLVAGTFTTPSSSTYNDIDPTVLIDTDDKGVEHRYLAWGNGKYYICELNEDMTSIKDIDGDGEIVMHKDVLERKIKSLPANNWFTEAPWLYKRDGKYYLFYAQNWREEMAYAMADSPMGRYDFKQIIMPPNATANTNHPSVIDFKGKTYFIYHNGALPDGNGYRRSVCVQELEFDENGYVYPLTETSIGLDGVASTIISAGGKYLGHDQFTNSSADSAYPLSVAVKGKSEEDNYNTAWEIEAAKNVPEGKDSKYYVSLQSVNKPGLYISAKDGEVTLTQDMDGKQGEYMTFKTVKGLDGAENTVSFESITDSGKYLTLINNRLELTYASDVKSASFTIGTASEPEKNTINTAVPESDPEPAEEITNNFDSAATGTIMSIQTADQGANTSYDGVSLYIGTRSSGGDSSTSWTIENGGVSGNALVMNSGKFVSASRGPRMQLANADIPDGYTMTGSVSIKLGSTASQVYLNDSTSSFAAASGTDITSYLSVSEYTEVSVTITNNADTYTRVISVGGKTVSTDYVSTYPIFWGTETNGTSAKVYFDNVHRVTTDSSGAVATPQPATAPEAYAEYTFDSGLNDSVSGKSATLTGSTLTTAAAADTEAAYIDDEKGGKAINFTGSGSYGLEIPTVPTGGSYTISFDEYLRAAVQFSPFVFMMNTDGVTASDEWISVLPYTHFGTVDDAPIVWSKKSESEWPFIVSTASKSIAENAWHNITISVAETSCTVYVDGKKISDGTIVNIIGDNTKLYLGVNAWDAPLNGAIDNLKIYNEALTAAQVKLIS